MLLEPESVLCNLSSPKRLVSLQLWPHAAFTPVIYGQTQHAHRFDLVTFYEITL